MFSLQFSFSTIEHRGTTLILQQRSQPYCCHVVSLSIQEQDAAYLIVKWRYMTSYPFTKLWEDYGLPFFKNWHPFAFSYDVNSSKICV